jgi:hypothetical protein
MLKWIMVLAGVSYSAVDLKAPFDVRKLGSSALFDTVEISTFLINDGSTTAISPLYPSTYSAVTVGTDTLANLRLHSVATINPKSYWSFVDTLVVIRGPFTISTWCDPLHAWGEGGYEVGNNVRSQAFNFHPTIQVVIDTVVLYDTLRIRDTLKVVEKDTVSITLHDTTRVTVTDTIFQKDTIRVTVRDTVVKKDTVKYCPPTLAKAASRASQAPVASVVYNAAGVKVWEGLLLPGAYPPAGLRAGLHLIVQGDQARRFRIAYR